MKCMLSNSELSSLVGTYLEGGLDQQLNYTDQHGTVSLALTELVLAENRMLNDQCPHALINLCWGACQTLEFIVVSQTGIGDGFAQLLPSELRSVEQSAKCHRNHPRLSTRMSLVSSRKTK